MILKRNEFLKKDKINEMMANEVNWGDSLIGRLFNSIARKAEIAYNITKIDDAIKKLQIQFDILADIINIESSLTLNIRQFYIEMSLYLGILIKEVKSNKSAHSLITDTKNCIGSIETGTYTSVPPDNETAKDKKVVLEKLHLFLDYLESYDDGGKDEEDEEEKSSGVYDAEIIKPNFKAIETKLQSPYLLYAGTIGNKLPKRLEDAKITELSRYKSSLIELNKALSTEKSKIVRKNSDDGYIEIEYGKIHDIYRNIAKKTHSDINDPKLVEILKEVNALWDRYKQPLKDKNKIIRIKKNDYYYLLRIYENLLPIINEIKIVKDIIKQLENSNDKTAPEPPNDSSSTKGIEQTSNKESDLVKTERVILSFQRFINENNENVKDTETTDGEPIENELKKKFDELFTVEFLVKYQVNVDEIEKDVKKSDKATITIDPIIEIVKLFNRAYKIHTPGIIPSGRTDGKVSNSVFREYEYVGEGSPGTQTSPGGGPYRNKTLFNKWESAVMDILKDSKYQPIFNQDTYFKIGDADERRNIKEEGESLVQGGGKTLLSFINELLDGGKLYKSGAQRKFIAEYFNVTIDEAKLGYTKREIIKNQKTADKQKIKTEYKFVKLLENNISKIRRNKSVGVIIRADDADGELNRTWFFNIIKWDDDKFYCAYSSGFPYKINTSITQKSMANDNHIFVGSGKVVGDRIIINKKRFRVDDTVSATDEFTQKLKSFLILITNDEVGEIRAEKSFGLNNKIQSKLDILSSHIQRNPTFFESLD